MSERKSSPSSSLRGAPKTRRAAPVARDRTSPKRDQAFARALATWFETSQRVLPWRSEPTEYRVWISEIMLQQTQVTTVKPYFERFIARFPNVNVLAAAPLDDVLKLWDGLGYYTRARCIHRAAQIIARDGFPQTHAGWLEIPGVGPYTAGAICSIALDFPTAIVDGNVERVMARFFGVGRSDAEHKRKWWALSERVLRAAVRQSIAPSAFNQALMELGALVCTPQRARCEACPVRAAGCTAFKEERVDELPGKKPRAAIQKLDETRHAWLLGDRVLLARNQPGEWRAGLWDFMSEAPARGAKALGQFDVQYVVTNHKICRTVHVWRVNRKTVEKMRESDHAAWESLHSPEHALGAAVKKSWLGLKRLAAREVL